MIILHIFLALLWACMVLGVGFLGIRECLDYAISADALDLPVYRALFGTVLRALATMAAVSVLVGAPILILGF